MNEWFFIFLKLKFVEKKFVENMQIYKIIGLPDFGAGAI
jgi:hypothetical protein